MITIDEVERAFREKIPVEFCGDPDEPHLKNGTYAIKIGSVGQITEINITKTAFMIDFGKDQRPGGLETAWLWNVAGVGMRRIRLFLNPEPTVDRDRYPVSCGGCGKPAYVSLFSNDCSASCGRTRP